MKRPETIEVNSSIRAEAGGVSVYKLVSPRRRVLLAGAAYEAETEPSTLRLKKLHMVLFDWDRLKSQKGSELTGSDEFIFCFRGDSFEEFMIYSTVWNGAGQIYTRTSSPWIETGIPVPGSYLFGIWELKPQTLAASWSYDQTWAFKVQSRMHLDMQTVSSNLQQYYGGRKYSGIEEERTIRDREIRRTRSLINAGIPKAYAAFYESCIFTPTYDQEADKLTLERKNVTTNTHWSLILPGHIGVNSSNGKVTPIEFTIKEPNRALGVLA